MSVGRQPPRHPPPKLSIPPPEEWTWESPLAGLRNDQLGDSTTAAVAHVLSILGSPATELVSESEILDAYAEVTGMPGSSPIFCTREGCAGFVRVIEGTDHPPRRTDDDVVFTEGSDRGTWLVLCSSPSCSRGYAEYSTPGEVQRAVPGWSPSRALRSAEAPKPKHA